MIAMGIKVSRIQAAVCVAAVAVACTIVALSMLIAHRGQSGLSNTYVTTSAIDIRGWAEYQDPSWNITFRYPCDWLVKHNNAGSLSLVPPWSSSEPAANITDEEGGVPPPFGINITPYAGGTAQENQILKTEIDSGLDVQYDEPHDFVSLSTRNAKLVLLYDLHSNGEGVIAFLESGRSLYTIDMGLLSSGLHRAADWMALFNILLTFKNSSTVQATTTADLSCPR